MDYPQWITLSELGTFSQDYSFELNPLIINYTASAGSKVTQINGSLPAGLRLETSASTIKLLGACVQTSTNIVAKFTMRITQLDGFIADRTFTINLTAVPLYPSWDEQDPFLGYQNNTLPQGYQLTAIAPAGQYITYSVVNVAVSPSAPVSVSINPTTGFLTCAAPSVITNNTIIQITVRASANLYSDLTCSIEVITVPGPPQWITPSGSLGIFYGDDFLEVNIEAKDLDNNVVTYSIASNPNNAPLSLSADGLLFGRLPNVTQETYFSLTINASSNGVSQQTFSITVVPSEALSLLKWETDSDLGFINDGNYYSVPIKASTTRNSFIVYNVVGGILPPNMIISKTGSFLQGYCEYHAVPKTYYFDIAANDGYQTITKQFKLQVNKLYYDIFFGISVPLMGSDRINWLQETANVRIREAGFSTLDYFTSIDQSPTMNIIQGILTNSDNATVIYNDIAPWCYQLDLQFGLASNSIIVDNTTSVYRNVLDYQQGSNVSVYSNYVYNTNISTDGIVYPISIDNIRKAISKDRAFITSGGGFGTILTPILDYSSGAITSVSVIDPGSNYTSIPEVKVTGSGSGANLTAVLGLVDIKIVNGGNGWEIGNIIEIKTGIATSYARITVTNVGPIGDIISCVIDYNGDYSQIPNSQYIHLLKNTDVYAIFDLIWGVTSIDVINGGVNYQNAINLDLSGSEILPWWQNEYSPIIFAGNINGLSGSAASNVLNFGTTSSYGSPWLPNYVVFSWEGLRWLGATTFDEEITSFDGNLTRFQETTSAYETIFDYNKTYFDDYFTYFDYSDPLEYDQAYIWGSTVFDNVLTIFNYYTTIFDKAQPKTYSSTLLRKLVRVNNKVYSGNNAVW